VTLPIGAESLLKLYASFRHHFNVDVMRTAAVNPIARLMTGTERMNRMTYSAPDLLPIGRAQNLVLGWPLSNGSAIVCCLPDSPNTLCGSIDLW
jgi:hypothetical protein